MRQVNDESRDGRKPGCVSTLVVEWIEISLFMRSYSLANVSTLVVEWIEIQMKEKDASAFIGLHPRGGVD